MANLRNRIPLRFAIPALLGIIVLAGAGIFFLVQALKPGGPGGTTIPPRSGGDTGDNGGTTAMMSGATTLKINLSAGESQPQAVEAMPLATGEPLASPEVEALLARLPTLTAEPGDTTEFNLPPEPLPPPLTGDTIQEAFPPPPEAVPTPEVSSGPLEVLRYAPEGEIPIAPFVNVTFNQPMVPLATLADLQAQAVPVQIEPPLPGTWRWLGTKTITFQFDSELIDRLPMATEYRVTIPAGTQSLNGGVLAQEVQFSFSTPPVTMQTSYPNGEAQPLEPVFFIAFDQRIEPQAVLDTIQVQAGGRPVSLKLASQAEIEADKSAANLVKSAQEGRWLAFRAAEPLPADSDIQVTIGPGTPSAEGPRLTQAEQSYSFRTYAPLRIEESGCTWYDKCPPLSPWFIRFNNPINAELYQESMLQISPELPGALVDISGNTLNIRGASKGQTTYEVTLSGEITDIFGQKLGKDTRLSFKVGPAEPVLAGPEQTFVTIDPAAQKPALSFYTINYTRLDVKIYAVQPSDWPAFQDYLRQYQQTDQPHIPPGRLVRDESQSIEAAADALTEVSIDLSQHMDGAYGHFIVIVKPPAGFFEKDRYWETKQIWVQVTQIGLDAFIDHSEMVTWASALKDGAPLSGVTIEGGSLSATTGEDGTARFSLPGSGIPYLVASLGADKALLPRSTYYWSEDSWYPRPVSDQLAWYVFDDRQMYRPGEEVHIKGWVRRIGGKQDGDVGLAGSALSGMYYQINDPQGNDLGNGRLEVTPLGGFDLAFTLPENANLGYAQLMLTAEGSLGVDNTQFYHGFQIQEFRRPEFEVSARNETTGPYFAGGSAVVAVEAKYYAGGPLPRADVTWQVSSNPTNYQPPNWPDFTFGEWQPWWIYYRSDVFYEGDFYGPPIPGGSGPVETFTGLTDAGGTHYLNLDFNKQDEALALRPYSVMAEATVMDVNRQAWAGSTSLLVHPASLYVGLHSEQTFVERGTPIKIELIVTDLDGNPAADRQIQVKAARLEWKQRSGEWKQEEVDVQECTVGSRLEPVSCTFETLVGGEYQITATIVDEQGRQNQSRFTRWVSGGERPPSRKVEQEEVTLIPDKESYQPGDTAQILVQSPFSPAEGLLTVSRSGLLYTQRFQLEDGSATLQIPIEEVHIPNLSIQVDLVGSAPRTGDTGEAVEGAPPRPAYASGQLNLSIPPLVRTLALQVTPLQTELEPGGSTSLDLLLKDAQGQPVAGAELAVVVVDEAVLALTNYRLADPLAVFYTQRSADLESQYGRASIVLVDPLALAASAQQAAQTVEGEQSMAYATGAADMEMPAPAAAPMEAGGMEKAAGEAQAPPIRVRSDFNPLATFAPTVQTDASGAARVEIKLPDNLTRYRVMVVAVDASGKLFGSGEANMTARLPLMVRPSAPRFLNFGDQFELPIVLQNQTGEAMSVDVAVQVANLALTGPNGLRVSVPAHDRVEVRFPAAAQMAGTARIQIAAQSGAYVDAASIELPVYTPATTEAFATYGVVDEGAVAQPVAQPTGVFPQFGGLEIQTSSTALQALTDAVLYLTSYPFECSEQLASRILGIAALRDVLSAFKAEGLPSPEAMEASVSRDLERLRGMQNNDGGFPYWRRGQDSIPYNSIHVIHAILRAGQNGYSVPGDMLSMGQEYLRQIENYYPEWYSQSTRDTLSAYALYVRAQAGDRDPDKARGLLKRAGLENLSLDAVGWIWSVLQGDPASTSELEAIRRYVGNRVVETPGAANFTTSYDDQTYLLLASNRRTDAILLDALMSDNPQSDLIPKLVNGLLAHRSQGRWYNTQENVFILLALHRYFETYEAQTPDFVARIWLGSTYAGEHTYQGYSTERHETAIPMAYLTDPNLGGGQTQNLVLSKEGTGRLYYRLGLRYAPTDLSLPPLDMGFVVQRSYEGVDHPEDVSRDENGAWHIKAGARVRVRIQLVADNRRYHVALVDPLPAGLEIVNPALAVSGSVPQDPNSSSYRYGWWWWGTWYEHQNMRDERAEAFTSLLWDGVYEYTYIARATTPGTFVVPPSKAEEMYSPEVFGRSAGDIVIIE